MRGRVAVVIGATGGIGAAVAGALAREGVHVALAARRGDALLDVQAGLDMEGGAKSLIAATDVTDRQQVKELVERARAGGDPRQLRGRDVLHPDAEPPRG